MIILNLGCGSKISRHTAIVNIDWSILLRLRTNRLLRLAVPYLLTGDRRKRFDLLGDNVMVHDLSKGIPFDSNSVDVVYHSHMLEHLDREGVPKFLAEVKRVLKPGGVHRIVVPDLELLCRKYFKSLERSSSSNSDVENHDGYVGAIIEQCVRKESAGSSLQPPFRRFIENALLGDARKRGETHQWMYDRVNLGYLLTDSGFKNSSVERYDTSSIFDWHSYYLDQNEEGNEYNPGSLYMESTK